MTEHLLIALTFSLALVPAAIFIKFVLLCQQAREEEFVARKKAVALARVNQGNQIIPR